MAISRYNDGYCCAFRWMVPGDCHVALLLAMTDLADFIMRYYVYILTNKYCTVLYTGVTNDLIRRVYEHKNHLDKNSFTAKYKVDRLVYFEETSDVKSAIEREKQIKSWNRERKTSLIMEMNPKWLDLYPKILG